MRREVIPKITTRLSAVLLYPIRIRLIKLLATQTLISYIEVFVEISVIVVIALIIRVNYRHLPVTKKPSQHYITKQQRRRNFSIIHNELLIMLVFCESMVVLTLLQVQTRRTIPFSNDKFWYGRMAEFQA